MRIYIWQLTFTFLFYITVIKNRRNWMNSGKTHWSCCASGIRSGGFIIDGGHWPADAVVFDPVSSASRLTGRLRYHRGEIRIRNWNGRRTRFETEHVRLVRALQIARDQSVSHLGWEWSSHMTPFSSYTQEGTDTELCVFLWCDY